ncbi:unnamed protein product [Owenia fusiformis]|uniref:Kazal-like domain-containing protein n=1 Tax=Owenia fusiformis TaxID=6347 RepID=A0A8S4PTL3_OWEFU|nr:unnamed protein product [Owenia fusiformis]
MILELVPVLGFFSVLVEVSFGATCNPPCNGVGEICSLVEGNPTCTCGRICTFDYRPVCGYNEKEMTSRTFGNKCALDAAICNGENLKLGHAGECLLKMDCAWYCKDCKPVWTDVSKKAYKMAARQCGTCSKGVKSSDSTYSCEACAKEKQRGPSYCFVCESLAKQSTPIKSKKNRKQNKQNRNKRPKPNHQGFLFKNFFVIGGSN